MPCDPIERLQKPHVVPAISINANFEIAIFSRPDDFIKFCLNFPRYILEAKVKIEETLFYVYYKVLIAEGVIILCIYFSKEQWKPYIELKQGKFVQLDNPTVASFPIVTLSYDSLLQKIITLNYNQVKSVLRI